MKYDLDIMFFERDSSELWYFIGFFYADGCITGRNVSFTLGGKDLDFLKRLVGLFSTQPPILYYIKTRNTYYATWISGRQDLKDKLQFPHFNIKKRKTDNIKFPEVPEEYMRDFIRGYFDGDGSVFKRRTRNNIIAMEIVCGSKVFAYQLLDYLKEKDIILGMIRREEYNTWCLRKEGKGAYKFFDFIYYPDCFCMERKRRMVA